MQNICVVANLVSDETKRKYEEAKMGYVWDIRNVLWLFEEYPELKNELISILNYSVETIEPKRPEPFILRRKAARRKLQNRNLLLTVISGSWMLWEPAEKVF